MVKIRGKKGLKIKGRKMRIGMPPNYVHKTGEQTGFSKMAMK